MDDLTPQADRDDRQGQIIIAGADMPDPNFARTVTLLVQHTPEGALGLTLNRPTQTSIAEGWAQVNPEPCRQPGMIYAGGPCDGPLMALHAEGSASQIEVVPGLHFTADAEDLAWLMSDYAGPLRCFVGYAGWGGGQLESELDQGSWIVRTATPGDVFDAGDDQWLSLIRQINPAQAAIIDNPALKTTDPSLN